MSDVARPHDLSDIIGQYFDQRPVEAVQLTGPDEITRVGRWITQNGGHCTWIAAHGTFAEAHAGPAANRLALQYEEGFSATITIGDWIVRDRVGRFSALTNEAFREIYHPVFAGQLEDPGL